MSLNTHPQFILYDNELAAGTVTFSNADSTHVGANIYDYKTTTRWKPNASGSQTIKLDAGSAISCDSFAVQGHNLSSTSSTVTLAHSSDDVTYTDYLSVTPADNNNFWNRSATAATKRYWRITITACNTSTYISNVFLGVALDLQTGAQVGFVPPTLARVDNVLRSVTEGGNFAGASVLTHEIETTIKSTHIPYSWIETNFPALREHVQSKPFFYIWDNNAHSDEVAFCWLPEGGFAKATYTHNTLCDLTIPIKGRML